MLRSSSSRGKAVFRFACGMLTSNLVAGVCHPYPIITSYSCFKVTSSFEERANVGRRFGELYSPCTLVMTRGPRYCFLLN